MHNMRSTNELKGLSSKSLDILSNVRRSSFELAANSLIEVSGDDPRREGLLDTPKRFSKAFDHILSGYAISPEEAVGKGIFQAEGRGLVSICDVEFYSLCEHHMLPFWGKVSVAYYPSKSIVGLSKIPRLVEVFARRLQVQERLTDQIADALYKLISPRAVVVTSSAQHLCMMMRGVEKQLSFTVSEATRGVEVLHNTEIERLYRAVNSLKN